MTIITTIKSI